jgi:alkylation response protein AidB-like acyl-CoA dehydrogenase
MFDRRLQEEIWGADPDTWVSSSYAPDGGRARPVDGGFQVGGHWRFSSGADQCDWVWLGGVVTDQNGEVTKPVEIRHFVLPRSDYEIVEDSWDVVGLRGTGSKDIVVGDVFVPEYRTIVFSKMFDGSAAVEAGLSGSPLYTMPFSAIFPSAITSAVIGIAEGALAAHVAYQRDRVFAGRVKMAEDPSAMRVIAEAGSEIRAARAQLLANVAEMFELAQRGDSIPLEPRVYARRDQIQSAVRAVRAVDVVFAHSGGNALRLDEPLQRFWRDAHAGLNHAIFVYGGVFTAASKVAMGLDPGNLVAIFV